MPAHKDLTGHAFNGIQLLRVDHINSRHDYHYACRCHCGRLFVGNGHRLKIGRLRSCGCIQQKRKHGSVETNEYGIWNAMKQRCLNHNNHAYRDYGGRGIKVCKHWLDFRNFLADMGRRPTKSHTLDRKDNDGNYEPSNCRWATKTEQALNRRNNVKLTHNGTTLTRSQWATRLGIKDSTLAVRLKKGWPLHKALGTPVQSRPLSDFGSIKCRAVV